MADTDGDAGTARPILTATVHDPAADFLPGLERVGPIVKEVFGAIAIQATRQTAPLVVEALERDLGATVGRAPADGRVGLHRRLAVGLALPAGAPILHIDLDHLLRWLEADREEVETTLTATSRVDLLVVGRTAAAMNACPRRLRETEAIANHVYELVTGHRWDLMFGVRVLSPTCATAIVEHCAEESIGNDVEWPLFAEAAGFSVGYLEAAGLSYRTRADFDTAEDARDSDPLQWITRIELLQQHAAVMRRFARRR